jgi:hypothetical protein
MESQSVQKVLFCFVLFGCPLLQAPLRVCKVPHVSGIGDVMSPTRTRWGSTMIWKRLRASMNAELAELEVVLDVPSRVPRCLGDR